MTPTHSASKTWLWSLILLALAVLFHMYFIVSAWKQPVILFGDAYYYDHSATVLNALHLYSYWSWGPAAQVTPGYPLFLSLIYRFASLFSQSHQVAMHTAQTVQHLLSVVTVMLVYRLMRFCLPRWASFIGALLWLVYPPVIYANNQLLTENLYIPCLLAFTFAFLTAIRDKTLWHFGVAGFWLAVTTLVRPSVMPLAVAPLLLLFDRAVRTQWRHWLSEFASYVGVFVLFMLPWWIRNAVVMHQLILTDLDSANPLLYGSDPNFEKDVSLSSGLSLEQQKALAIHRIEAGFHTHPLMYLKWYTLDKIGLLFDTPWYNSTLAKHAGLLTRATFAYAHLHILWVVVGAIGLLMSAWFPYLRWIAALALFLIVVQLPFIPINRYAYPTMPFFFLGVGVVLYGLQQLWLRRAGATPTSQGD
ncbi:hypothetical protein Heshes_15470 [Alicyclobacillus hesperidum]|uniref:Dolichyl-phosphate-mannose-protein mannosyltransferase n=1 Tax=Alicyclobacillus hesperidum TaxID=89784 RepID=A0A1H2TFJ9_9BACL|nr:glycosyltransferase family 39 protein [Alicyclobacillus hesperidum]GLV13863.1 hypothetical protein Heshes_15470 [Alicyclobacillus hesperidum]SDW42009.1 Dolichyl-phosphate-mannose-protein mannosyltransferase [Alicyclobacillus hesperidum]